MIPSRPTHRRLAVVTLAVLSLSACGGESADLAPDVTTGVTADVTADVTAPGVTGASGPSTSSTAPTDGSAAVTTAPGATETSAAVGAATTTVKAGATTTTVKGGATTTTVKPTSTTVKPPTTTAPVAPPTTKPTSNPGTFTATVANKSHRTLNVPYNSTVVLTVTSATDEEFHVHGYDITKGGTNVTFVFTADMKGTYIVESHDTGWVVCTLVVA